MRIFIYIITFYVYNDILKTFKLILIYCLFILLIYINNIINKMFQKKKLNHPTVILVVKINYLNYN